MAERRVPRLRTLRIETPVGWDPIWNLEISARGH